MVFIDLINKRFSKLLVIEKLDRRGKTNKQIFWKCICDCGRENEIVGFALRYGKAKSCGKCPRVPHNKQEDRENVLWNVLYTRLNSRAKNYGECDIDYNTFKILSTKICFYCGLESSNLKKDNATNNKFHSDTQIKFNGLDRVNSKLGYVLSNVVSCCKQCNMAKNDMSVEEYKSFINRVYKNIC